MLKETQDFQSGREPICCRAVAPVFPLGVRHALPRERAQPHLVRGVARAARAVRRHAAAAAARRRVRLLLLPVARARTGHRQLPATVIAGELALFAW